MSLFDDLMKDSRELDALFDQIDGKKPALPKPRPRPVITTTDEESGLHHRLYQEYLKLDKLCMQCAPDDGCGGIKISVTRRCPVCGLLSCSDCLPDPKMACNHCRVLFQPRQ